MTAATSGVVWTKPGTRVATKEAADRDYLNFNARFTVVSQHGGDQDRS
jgi:hypothetical protein